MAEFETVKALNPIDLGFGRFLEVSLKRSPQGKTFINLSRGEFWYDGKEQQKRYKRSIAIPDGSTLRVINALKELLKFDDKPTNPEIDKG
jgi:hypothetical protein